MFNSCKLVAPVLVAATFGVGLAIGAHAIAAETPKSGGTLNVTLEADLASLDPLRSQGSFNDREANLAAFDSLLEVNAKGEIVPNLAERIESAEDATWFRLTLRSGVKFHDGTPLDAAAVVAHFNRMLDPKQHCTCVTAFLTLASVEATGPMEVTFRMKAPSAQFPVVLADTTAMIVSPAAVAKYGDDFGSHPVGTGPFIFKDWQRGSQIVYERNPNYWKNSPYLDRVVFRPLPDEQSRYASLKAGNVDVVMNPAPNDIVDARSRKDVQVINPGSLATNFVQLNLAASDVSDLRVRQAMAYALDRDALNKVINKGVYKVANTVFGSGLTPHEQVDGYPQYDAAKAKQQLADYGKPVKLKMTVAATPQIMQLAQVLQQMWKKVGIDTEIVPLEFTQVIRASTARDYQAMLYRFAGRADPDTDVYPFFYSTSPGNRVNYKSAEMDKLLDAGRATRDPAERLKIYRQVNNLLAKDLPYLLLTYFDNYALASSHVHGIAPIPDGLIRLNSVWKDN